jgi:hypothetical protein
MQLENLILKEGAAAPATAAATGQLPFQKFQINISVMQFTWVYQRGGNSAEFEWLGVY